MEIYQVDPAQVRRRRSKMGMHVSESSWRYQAQRLETEGQIEPIEVVHDDDPDALFPYMIKHDAWVYAEAQVIAAIELNWPTILVTY